MTVRVPHRNAVSEEPPSLRKISPRLISQAAEFRNPGEHHTYDDDDDNYDLDERTRDMGGRPGRIILLGDGTEVLTDSADTDLFNSEDEDKDLEAQVPKDTDKEKSELQARSAREGTPAPTSNSERQMTPDVAANTSATPEKIASPTSAASDKTEAREVLKGGPSEGPASGAGHKAS